MVLMIERMVRMGEQIREIAEDLAVNFDAVNLFAD